MLFLVPELRLPGLRCLPEVVDNQGSTGGQVTLNRDGVERHLVAMGVVQRGQYPAFGRPMHSPCWSPMAVSRLASRLMAFLSGTPIVN